MAGETTRHKLPFPESSDPVKEGAAKIAELATKLDTTMGPNVVVRKNFSTGAPTTYSFAGTSWSYVGFSFPCVENQTFLLYASGIVRNPSGTVKNCYMPYKFQINGTDYRQCGVNPPNLQYATFNHMEAWVANFTGTCNGKFYVKSENGAILHNKSSWALPQIIVVRL